MTGVRLNGMHMAGSYTGRAGSEGRRRTPRAGGVADNLGGKQENDGGGRGDQHHQPGHDQAAG